MFHMHSNMENRLAHVQHTRSVKWEHLNREWECAIALYLEVAELIMPIRNVSAFCTVSFSPCWFCWLSVVILFRVRQCAISSQTKNPRFDDCSEKKNRIETHSNNSICNKRMNCQLHSKVYSHRGHLCRIIPGLCDLCARFQFEILGQCSRWFVW